MKCVKCKQILLNKTKLNAVVYMEDVKLHTVTSFTLLFAC